LFFWVVVVEEGILQRWPGNIVVGGMIFISSADSIQPIMSRLFIYSKFWPVNLGPSILAIYSPPPSILQGVEIVSYVSYTACNGLDCTSYHDTIISPDEMVVWRRPECGNARHLGSPVFTRQMRPVMTRGRVSPCSTSPYRHPCPGLFFGLP
jgi:hypothetical protein